MKKFLTSALLFATAAATAQTATYTSADVAQHATAADCWMILNSSSVYDFTGYIASHPGGNAMVPYCGKDGTQAFTGLPHSSRAASLQASYLIGSLGAATAPISVSLAPANASVTVGGTVQLTPTVNNSTAGVAWTVAPATLGTISASGRFTAVTAGQGTVTATSMADPTRSASALITVNAATPTPTGSISVTVSPAAVTVAAGAKARFRANVVNSSQGVTWTVTGGVGTIDANGTFTAGATPGTGSVSAQAVGDPTRTASAEVTVTTATCAPTSPRGREHGDGRGSRRDD